MSTPIRVKVTVDTDELREWAGKHADAGRHGVAHVLYKAADDGESLSGQATREMRDQITADALELVREWTAMDGRGGACLNLRGRDLADFRDQLADVISGRAS